MKFSELKIGDRFRPTGYGQYLDVIYEKLNDDYSKITEHFNKTEIGDKLSFESDTEVEKLGPAIDSELGEAIKAFLKERMRISITKPRSYRDLWMKLEISIDDEIITEDKILLIEGNDD